MPRRPPHMLVIPTPGASPRAPLALTCRDPRWLRARVAMATAAYARPWPRPLADALVIARAWPSLSTELQATATSPLASHPRSPPAPPLLPRAACCFYISCCRRSSSPAPATAFQRRAARPARAARRSALTLPCRPRGASAPVAIAGRGSCPTAPAARSPALACAAPRRRPAVASPPPGTAPTGRPRLPPPRVMGTWVRPSPTRP
nr:DBF4-type zinc finger-containing protein 2 homolog [Aegilops tauschii subsp. strangulata]